MAKKKKASLADSYEDVVLTGDCGHFTLKYTPRCDGGKTQHLVLDAEEEGDVLFEAASILQCDESELPEIAWL